MKEGFKPVEQSEYFDVETKRQILDNVRRVLAPDGLLFLGASETTLNIHDAYASVRLGASTAYALESERSELWFSPTMLSTT